MRNGKEQALRATVENSISMPSAVVARAAATEREQPRNRGQDSFGPDAGQPRRRWRVASRCRQKLARSSPTSTTTVRQLACCVGTTSSPPEVNGQKVSSAATGKGLQKIASGPSSPFLIWRGGGGVFVTVKKERRGGAETGRETGAHAFASRSRHSGQPRTSKGSRPLSMIHP